MVTKDGLLFSSAYDWGYNITTGYYGRYVLKRFRQQQSTGKLEQLPDEVGSYGFYNRHDLQRLPAGRQLLRDE